MYLKENFCPACLIPLASTMSANTPNNSINFYFLLISIILVIYAIYKHTTGCNECYV